MDVVNISEANICRGRLKELAYSSLNEIFEKNKNGDDLSAIKNVKNFKDKLSIVISDFGNASSYEFKIYFYEGNSNIGYYLYITDIRFHFLDEYLFVN